MIKLFLKQTADRSRRAQTAAADKLCELALGKKITRLSSGKPVVVGGFVSVSHSGNLVGLAYSDNPVGFDIERVREVKRRVIERVCSAEELGLIEDGEPFIRIWTKKEAAFKLKGDCDYSALELVQGDIEFDGEEFYFTISALSVK